MSYNFINYNGKLTAVSNCIYDSNIGYESDFSRNGEVDGWLYYDGIHTYGCWNNFLFGTLYGSYGVIGRYETFLPVAAEDFYIVRLVMKLNLKERVAGQAYPTYGRIMWRTLGNSVWSEERQHDFELILNSEWNTYTINMGEIQWWQGDINDLRIYPILSNGRDGDEFYIRTIEIKSVNTFKCKNYGCDYYTRYEHNCPGIGERGYCKSIDSPSFVSGGASFDFAEQKTYNIVEGVNDLLLVNINEYGFENVVLDPATGITASSLANSIANAISKLDVGGYAECYVECTDRGAFVIYSGVYADDSTVRLGDTPLARELNFFDSSGNDISTKYVGRDPASGFKPFSSFRIKTSQLYALTDKGDGSEFYFDPFSYSIEGGRRDWLLTGLGAPEKDIRGTEEDSSNMMNRKYKVIENSGKTLIDFSHPFNASGRIKKIFIGLTLDTLGSQHSARGPRDEDRIETQLSGAKVKFFRPLKDGTLRVLPMEVAINNRDHDNNRIYAAVQEYVELDCDLFINKGDLIGIYNANIYKGFSIDGNQVDAVYYQVDGDITGEIEVDQPQGEGSGGLLVYARSDYQQKRLVLELDLGKRVNVENIDLIGQANIDRLDYNIARCLDVDWQVELFGEDHTTGYIIRYRPLLKAYYNHPNVYYGKECLNDGITIVPDGLAADNYTVQYGTYYNSYNEAVHKKNGGVGVILSGAKYFSVNGDCEWLSIYHHVDRQAPFSVGDFEEDPIAFTLIFPLNKNKMLYKSKIYFKDQLNFRSFALSTYEGAFYTNGNADDVRFTLIPYRTDGTKTPWTKILLNGTEYTPENPYQWERINLYLAENPTIGHAIHVRTAVLEQSYNSEYAYFDELGGLNYYAKGVVQNMDQYLQALKVDWTILEHQWEPIETKGFRFYCNYHNSTKITEFEVFCVVPDIRSSLDGTVSVEYSMYGEEWWPAQPVSKEFGVRNFIGDTPRYARITVNPIVETRLSDLDIDVSFEDVFVGSKGCDYSVVSTEAKRGATSSAQRVEFKNVYGRPYDLFVDIDKGTLSDRSAIFYSVLNNPESVSNPVIGADAYYKKHKDYLIFNRNGNVAINCPVYRLKSLTEGAEVWYSYDNEYSWQYYGRLESGNNLNFSNLPNVGITTINLPVFNRSKWWKFGFRDPRISMNVREVRVYYQGQEIDGVNFYHQKNAPSVTGANVDTAPHMQNRIVDGSYYVLEGYDLLGFELPLAQAIDQIVIYHDYLTIYENSSDKAGIDIATALCLHREGEGFDTDIIYDDSYYEHEVLVVGSGIYFDTDYTEINYSFTEDFSNCEEVVETFPGPEIDTSFWQNAVNASIVDETLHITNSGIIGELTTIDYFQNDFNITVDLSILNNANNAGWGCYLYAVTDENSWIRIGRDYGSSQRVASSGFNTSGFQTIYSYNSSATTGIQLRMKRTGITTYFYFKTGTGSFIAIGSSTIISALPVRFKLESYLSPQATGITTAVFDNFNVGSNINTDYNSTFTCTSGLSPSSAEGWAYFYDMGVANHSDAAGYVMPEIFEYQNKPLDQDFEFTFKFVFQAESFLSYTGSSTNNCGVSVGIFSQHQRWYSGYYTWREYLVGAQVVLRRDNIGIAIQNVNCETASIYTTLSTTAMPYYCTFTSNGAGTYTVTVWSDDWDGSNQVATVTLESEVKWEADKVGVGSGYSTIGNTSNVDRCRGWVTDFDFTSYKKSIHQKLNTAIRFSGYENEHLLVKYENSPNCNIAREGFHFDTKRFTIDFFVMFSSLPAEEGDVAWLVGSWHPNQPLTGAINPSTPSSWLFCLQRVSGSLNWKMIVNDGGVARTRVNFPFFPDLYRWYHIMVCRGPSSQENYWYVLLKDGRTILYDWVNPTWSNPVLYSGADVVIGRNLSGWMSEVRVSSDYGLGGGRSPGYSSTHQIMILEPPVSNYDKYYTMSLYDSADNGYYGKMMDVDVLFDNSFSYHEPLSVWSETYYTFFALDFGQRHNIELIRSFPIDTSFQITRDSNVLYSNKDTADPVEAFTLTEQEAELDTEFEGQNYDYPHNFTKNDSTRAVSYIIDGYFYQMANPIAGQEYAKADFNPYFKGDFDFQIDFSLKIPVPETNSWRIGFQIEDLNNSNNKVRFERAFVNGAHQYTMWVMDNATTWTQVSLNYKDHTIGTLRLERVQQTFKAYFKETSFGEDRFTMMGFRQMVNGFGIEAKLSVITLSDGTGYPRIENYWDNFVVNVSDPLYSSASDTRWARIKMLNGDGVTRTLQNIGIYPNIKYNTNEIGQYNCEWESLGPAVTNYSADVNIALGATVSGSSFVGAMFFENITDGVITEGKFEECWGSRDEDNPYVTIILPNLEQIYRIKIYHGYDSNDDTNIITDYEVQISEDGVTYTTIFDIDDNTEFVRTHDLVQPVWAKYVRIFVNAYEAINRYTWIDNEVGFQFWKGAILREVEVYKYYGFSILSSEEAPIIAIDLRQNYFIYGHSLVGPYTEYPEYDWNNDDSNFAYGNSHLSDPRKISFRDWGGDPAYDKWVAIKRNTATRYPTVPVAPNLQTDMPDYLKHAVIHAHTNDMGSYPNPISYPWMWRSSISTLSYDYDNIMEGRGSERSLKIEYPASSNPDHVYFIEGDVFGVDSVASWRDGLGIFVHIDDIDALDLEYGYIYFGGFDYTSDRNPVVYRWNMTTISGSLKTGWNNLLMTFLYADLVEYTPLSADVDRDPRRLHTIDWGKVGMVFRGKGQPLTINLDGMSIVRNHFEHGCFQDYGLYLHAHDMLKVQLSEFNLSSGTIEFFIRPDWNLRGKDIYKDHHVRSLFSITNVNNDVFGALVSFNGIEIFYGNALNDFRVASISEVELDVLDKVTHLAFVFSNNGSSISSDSSTIRLYINNILIAKVSDTWTVSDKKHFTFIFGGPSPLIKKTLDYDYYSSAVDGVLSRLKIYNYCKTDFSDSIQNKPSVQKALTEPNEFIEISRDNLTFHRVGSDQLPFFFEDVPAGETVPIWFKVSLPKDLTGREKRTAKILGSWDIGV